MSERVLKSPFAPRVFIVNHKRKHRFVSTAKAGCTTLKYVTAVDDKLFKFKRNEKVQSVHNKMGYAPNGRSLIPIDSEEHDVYTSLAVWRDPVERFMSWYRDKILHPYQPYVMYSGLALDSSIDRCLEFLKFELTKSNPDWIDEHVRPHHKYYNHENINVFVDMEDLTSYLQSIGIDYVEQTNKARKAEGPTRTQIQKIKSLYEGDYKMYEQIQNKMWSKP